MVPQLVGIYRISFQVVTDVSGMLTFGFGMSAFYFIARGKEAGRRAILNILLFYVLVGAGAFLVLTTNNGILGGLFQSKEVAALSTVIGLVIWIWLLSSFFELAALANGEPKIASVVIVFSQLSKATLLVTAVWIWREPVALLWAAFVHGLLQTVFLVWYLISRFPGFWRSFSPTFFFRQAKYALPFGLAGVLYIFQSSAQNYFVGHYFSETEFAVFAYGCFQLPLLSMVYESLTAVLIPKMSELGLAGDKPQMVRLTFEAICKLALVNFPVFFFFLVFSSELITTLFTKAFKDSVPLFQIFLILIPFQIFVSDPIVRAYEKLGRVMLILRIVLVALFLAVLYFLVHLRDLRLIVGAVVGLSLLEKAVAETLVFREIGTKISDLKGIRRLPVIAFASAVSGGIAYFLKVVLLFNGVGLVGTIAAALSPHMALRAVETISGGVALGVGGLGFGISYLVLLRVLRFVPRISFGSYKELFIG